MSTAAIIQSEDLTSEPSSASDHDQWGFTARLEGDAVVACAGELDLATNSALRRSLNRVLRLAPDRVVVDLSRVSFFGAGALMARAVDVDRLAPHRLGQSTTPRDGTDRRVPSARS